MKSIDLEAIKKNAEDLEMSLNNLHEYVNGVNDAMSRMNSTVNSVLNQDNMEEYIDKVKKAYEYSQEMKNILSDGQSVFKGNLGEMSEAIKSLSTGKDDLSQLIEKGYEFIQRVENISDIQQRIKCFENLSDDLADVDLICNNFKNVQENAEKIVTASKMLSDKLEEIHDVSSQINEVYESIQNAYKEFSDGNAEFKESFQLQRIELSSYANWIDNISQNISENATIIEQFQKEISNTIKMQDDTKKILTDINGLYEGYILRIEQILKDINGFKDKMTDILQNGLEKIQTANSSVENSIKKNNEQLNDHIEAVIDKLDKVSTKHLDEAAKITNLIDLMQNKQNDTLIKILDQAGKNSEHILNAINESNRSIIYKLEKMEALQAELKEKSDKNEKNIKKICIAGLIILALLLSWNVYNMLNMNNLDIVNTSVQADNKKTSGMDDMGIGTIGGITLRNTNIEEVYNVYGSPNKITTGSTPLSDCYLYGSDDYGAPFEVYYNRKTKTISGIIIRKGSDLSTSKGIKIYDNESKLTSTYEEADTVEDYEGAKHYVYTKDGELIEFWVSSYGKIYTIHSQVI